MLEERSNISIRNDSVGFSCCSVLNNTFCRSHPLVWYPQKQQWVAEMRLICSSMSVPPSPWICRDSLWMWPTKVSLLPPLWARSVPASAASFTWKRTFGGMRMRHLQPRMKGSNCRSCPSPPFMLPSSRRVRADRGKHLQQLFYTSRSSKVTTKLIGGTRAQAPVASAVESVVHRPVSISWIIGSMTSGCYRGMLCWWETNLNRLLC